MATINLTTVDRVKRRGGFSDVLSERDAMLLADLIEEVSADADEYMARHIRQQSRTEVYKIKPHQNNVHVKGAPIVTVTSVKYNETRDFSSITAIDTDLYNTDTELGVINFRGSMIWAPGYVEVVYSGGLVAAATDELATNAFIDAYPHVAGALDTEVIERHRRRLNPSGSVTTKGGGTVLQQTSVFLLRDVRRRLSYLKRRRWN